MNDNKQSIPSFPLARVLLLALAALLLVAFLYLYSGRDRNVTSPPATISRVTYDSEIKPTLTAYEKENDEALHRLRKRIGAQFKIYRRGVEPFAEEITSWDARYNIAINGAGELLFDDNELVEHYVRGVFEQHIVSEYKLKRDLKRLLIQFKQDTDASRNRMLSDIETTLSKHPESQLSQLIGENGKFLEYVDREVGALSKDAGIDGAVGGGLTFATGVAVEEVVRITVTMAVQRVAYGLTSTVANSALLGGGTAATTTPAGGGGGSLAGPAGTVIGIGAGFIVGGAIDWWMTDRLEGKLVEQANQFLLNVQKHLIRDKNGYYTTLEREVLSAEVFYQKAMEVVILGGSEDE